MFRQMISHEPALTLAKRVIAVPEARELDVFAGLLERRGAVVLRCPLVAIRDAPNPEPVLAWLEWFTSGRCDDLILFTGEGVRRLLSCIDRHAPTLRDSFLAQLARVRKITRGPKPARALRELALQAELPAAVATTDGVIAVLQGYDLRGRNIGLQLYGSDPNERLANYLRSAGAQVFPVAPYIYADSSDDSAVQSLGQRLLKGDVDAIAFTSMQQVQRLFAALGEQIANAALGRTLVAAVGPLVAAALRDRGITVQLMPEEAFFLKPLTRILEQQLGPKPPQAV
jgi:uroporphyrinogen-III synthase